MKIEQVLLAILEVIVIAIVYIWRVARKPDAHDDLRLGISMMMLSGAKRDGSIVIEREEDEATIHDRVIAHLRSEGYVIDDKDAAEIRAHLSAMLESLGYEQSFDDLVASVMVYKNLTTGSGCKAGSCAGCETPCTWNGDWYFDATSPMGEQDTFGSYLEERDAREGMKRLQEKGYTDFNGPYQC